MTQFRSHLTVTLLVFALALAAWIGNQASHALIQVPQTERVLEIERYPDEPLQLVNLRIGAQSVKDRVKQKLKDDKSKWGIDSVKFNEKDDWVKRISLTLRNTSDKPVLGLQGLLFFKPLGFPTMFSVPLTASRSLRHDPLQPGTEIELTLNPSLLNHTLEDVKHQGADLRGAVVSFSLDTVIFSDELRWYRGHLVRPDSAVPNKWVPVDEPLAMKRNKPQVKTASASFVRASFKSKVRLDSAEPVEPTPVIFATCTQYNGSFTGITCPNSPADCISRTDIDDNINPGLLSHASVSGLCVDARDLGLVCTQSTTHSRLQLDQNCQVCPDADGDGFQAASCGGQDCDDTPGTGAAVNPNASESCGDGVDNNCDGKTDDQDFCSCGQDERAIWLPGGGADCSLCGDGVDNDCDDTIDGEDTGCQWTECASPVLVDVSGNGFDLTNAANGVNFDLNSDGTREKLSWTALNSDDAWLALDRNGDGVINDGMELFGNFTPQANPPSGYGKNGFNALVEYDRPAKGGNSDGLITEQDSVFGKLWLWRDRNHNGVSEANELSTVKQLGLRAIECDYKDAKRRDKHGNLFRYRAKVTDTRNTRLGRWAWDVFLVTARTEFATNLLRPFETANGVSFPWK